MVIASLVIAIVTLVIAILIQSETREVLGNIDAIMKTSPGAYDVDRVRRDIETTGEYRAKVVCVAPKYTHISYEPCSSSNVPRSVFRLNRLWRCLYSLAKRFSGDIEIPVDKPCRIRWEIKSCCIGSEELNKSLAEGWEPFSVTTEGNIWLRKEALYNPK